MTGAEFKTIRIKLGRAPEAFARALGYSGSAQSCRTTTYCFESGHRAIPDTVARLAVMLGRHGIPDAAWFDGDALTRLVAMFRHHGVPAERSFESNVNAGA